MCREHSRLLLVTTLQADRLRDVIEFLVADFLERFSLGRQFFINLDSLFRHGIVGFLRSADEREVWACGNPLMAVGIQSDSEDDRAFF